MGDCLRWADGVFDREKVVRSVVCVSVLRVAWGKADEGCIKA